MLVDSGGGATGWFRAARRRIPARALPIAAVVSAFLLVLFGLATLALSLSDLEAGFQQVGYTELTLRHTNRLATQISSAEASGRGYMVAAEEPFLAQLNEARRGISRELGALAALSGRDPAQLRRLAEMDSRLRLHLGSYDKALAPGDPQLDVLLTHLRSMPSLRMDPQLDTALSQFRDAEFLALRQRQTRAGQEATVALAVSALAMLLALISVAAGLYLIARARARGELSKLREEFAHVSRLNAMGEVAAMLAHEVKQPLTASSNYLSVVRRQLANDEIGRDKVAEIVEKISAQLGRAVDIIQRLRTHVSRAGEAATPEGVAETINEAVSLSAIARSNLAIALNVEDHLPPVCIDKVQIQQVLVNLMRNAAEAMADRPRQAIVISARRTDGRMVRIEVRDSGPGLPEEVRENLFRPFTTTKAGGMGVGLSICRSIIHAHGGNIGAETGPDGGTVFAFTVPEA